MPYIATLDIMQAVKASLATLRIDPADPESAPLFETIDMHINKKLKEALKNLLILDQRVCLIVPGGENYENIKEGRTIRSEKDITFDLLIADRDWAEKGHDATFGGPENIGILRMADRVVEHFLETPQLGMPYVCIVPTAMRPIDVPADDVKDSPGRECYVINYESPAGSAILTPTVPWSAPSPRPYVAPSPIH
ncbi:hypothetical protein OPIT5_08335 [Opitutaceae bacterium TAV5]|nr:hypothetical protein OPIT5_08335 [Opitutaceae bacterium TAV5]